MSYFRQIIFPPIPVAVDPSPTTYNFRYWIIGTIDHQTELWVKCPLCSYAYKYKNILTNTDRIKEYLVEYEVYHYRMIIRKCPNPSNVKHLVI